MEEKLVKIGSKEFKVRELLATELDRALEIADKKESLKLQITLSAGLTDEQYNELTVKERLTIVQTINDINGVSGFQKNSN